MLWSIIRTAATMAANLLVLPWLSMRIRTARDRDRAIVIEAVARAIAAEVVMAYPTSGWAALLEEVITLLGNQLPPGARTENVQVLHRVATKALTEALAAKNAAGV